MDDIDADGDLDIAYADTGSTFHYIDSAGNDNNPTGSTTYKAPGGMGDLDSDGDLDVPMKDGSWNLCIIDSAGNTVTEFGGQHSQDHGGMGDFDGDGDLDLAYRNYGDDELHYIDNNKNNTDTGFAAPTVGAIGDLDNGPSSALFVSQWHSYDLKQVIDNVTQTVENLGGGLDVKVQTGSLENETDYPNFTSGYDSAWDNENTANAPVGYDSANEWVEENAGAVTSYENAVFYENATLSTGTGDNWAKIEASYQIPQIENHIDNIRVSLIKPDGTRQIISESTGITSTKGWTYIDNQIRVSQSGTYRLRLFMESDNNAALENMGTTEVNWDNAEMELIRGVDNDSGWLSIASTGTVTKTIGDNKGTAVRVKYDMTRGSTPEVADYTINSTGPPALETLKVENVSAVASDLIGEFENLRADNCDIKFQVRQEGTATWENYGEKNISAVDNYVYSLTSLEDNTTYEWRFRGKNAVGLENIGSTKTFTTDYPRTAVTKTENVDATGFDIVSEVQLRGEDNVDLFFEYKEAGGTWENIALGNKSTTDNFTDAIESLKDNVTYDYRMEIIEPGGTSYYSSQDSFTTDYPRVSFKSKSEVRTSSFSVTCSVENRGEPSLDVYVEYREKGTSAWENKKVTGAAGTKDYSVTLSDLKPDTEYEVRWKIVGSTYTSDTWTIKTKESGGGAPIAPAKPQPIKMEVSVGKLKGGTFTRAKALELGDVATVRIKLTSDGEPAEGADVGAWWIPRPAQAKTEAIEISEVGGGVYQGSFSIPEDVAPGTYEVSASAEKPGYEKAIGYDTFHVARRVARPGPAQRAVGWMRKHPGMVAVAIIALLLLVLIAGA